MAIQFWSSRDSKVFIGTKELEGVQSIEWKVDRSRIDVDAVGSTLRQGVAYGTKRINGTIKIKSTSDLLDPLLHKDIEADGKFNLQLQLKRNSSADDKEWTVTLQDCYLEKREVAMDVNGVAVGVYSFTATNI